MVGLMGICISICISGKVRNCNVSMKTSVHLVRVFCRMQKIVKG